MQIKKNFDVIAQTKLVIVYNFYKTAYCENKFLHKKNDMKFSESRSNLGIFLLN